MDETVTTTQDRNRVFSDNPQDNLARFGTTGVSGPNVDRTQGLTDAQLRVIRQQQNNPVTAPSPFTVNIADVPSSALSSISRADVLRARDTAENQVRSTLAEQNVLQNRILEAITPTQQEQQLQARLRESAGAEEAGVLGATERALGTTRVARAVQGEQALITQQEQARRRVLADELNALINQRATTIDGLTQALEFSQENLAGLQTLQQLTKPDVLGTQVDKTTGQIIATVQDPNGNVRTEIIGSVTPEVQAKELRNTGTFTDEQGNLVFFGTDETGQIVKQVVGKEQVDPRQALDLQIKQAQLRGIQLDNQTIQDKIGATQQPFEPLSKAGAQANIDLISSLTQSPAIDSVVGPTIGTRGAQTLGGFAGRFLAGATAGGALGAGTGALFGGVGAIPGAVGGAALGGLAAGFQGAKDVITGESQNLISGIEQVRSNLNLETLIQAKKKGATFGALSDQELRVLANAATRLGTWAVEKDGKVIGYSASEKDFRSELDKINNFAKLDFVLKGGDPIDVGARIMDDGTVWVENSDGSFSQLR